MKKDGIFVRRGKNSFAVDRVVNIRHSLNSHPDYSLHTSDVSAISDNGLLIIFDLIPVNEQLPRFRGRWDQNKEVMDIDILNVDEVTYNDFRSERNGYSGHHPPRASVEERRFEINITIPGQNICSGWVSLNINWGHGAIQFLR